MRIATRKRLTARGWAVGGAREFLKLTEEEAAFVELKLALADGLKELRLKRGLSQTQLAAGLAAGPWGVGIMVGGGSWGRRGRIVGSLLAVGTTRTGLAKILTRMRAA